MGCKLSLPLKIKLFFTLIFISNFIFSQEEIYFYKDSGNILSLENIKEKEFSLLKNEIKEGYNEATYWFKIPAHKTTNEYVFKLEYDRYNDAEVFQDSTVLKKLENQRYLSYKFFRTSDLYIKIKPKLHSYIPIIIHTIDDYSLKERNSFLLNGFYYGFCFLIILYNTIFYFSIKDKVFLYYSLFQITLWFGVFTMDGMLNFYNISGTFNEVIMVLNYLAMAFFCSKFAVSYLFLNSYFPKLKNYINLLGFFIFLSAVLYLTNYNYYYLFTLNFLVFALISIYWICGILLFNKNVYTKIIVFADAIILFSAIDFFVLKFLGISLINIDAVSIKIGAFVEMIILSFAVLYRMNILIKENRFMKNEIIKYSEEFNKLSISEVDKKRQDLNNLSVREREIFELILKGNSNKEIAALVNISVNTVKFHIKNIYEKLHIKSRKEALNLRE